MIVKISLYSVIFSVAKSPPVHPVGYCSIAPTATIPFLLALIFFILSLLKLIKKPYEIDGNQLDFVMIGLTQRFGFQFLQKL